MNYPATMIVHTVKGPVYCCFEHAEKLIALQRFLGAHAFGMPAPGRSECSNCRNEASASVHDSKPEPTR